MKTIIEPDRYNDLLYYALSENEMKLLSPLMRKTLEREIEKLSRRYEKYKGIHESGEATEKQQDRLIKIEDELDTITKFHDVLQRIQERSKL